MLNHLKLNVFNSNLDKKKQRSNGGGYNEIPNREKSSFSEMLSESADAIAKSLSSITEKTKNSITASLIYEIKINQSVSVTMFEKELLKLGIKILSVADGKRGYWVVFSDDIKFDKFKNKLVEYGSEDGHNYDFFNAIESIRDIPAQDKIGHRLLEKPLSKEFEFIDVELWKMEDPEINKKFITQLGELFKPHKQFRITDRLITKNIALLRLKANIDIQKELLLFKEILRVDRPSVIEFAPSDYLNPPMFSEFNIAKPQKNAVGILIVDSGIISNHPLLKQCVGNEENYQTGETSTIDTVGHGTAVAGCAAYGDIGACIDNKLFTPANYIFSAKVMYLDSNAHKFNNTKIAIYDNEKLVESQFCNAVEDFISNEENNIKVVNISLGNSREVFNLNYSRQLPFAALIDELAYKFPNVIFVVSAGNLHPFEIYGSRNSLDEIQNNYPFYISNDPSYRIINPATAALAITVGSIAPQIEYDKVNDSDKIKVHIADFNQPSPFTRSGPGINGMIKPEVVEYGGNLILYNNHGRVSEDRGGKITVLKNNALDGIFSFDSGTSFSAPKISHILGQLFNKYPQRSGNFIKNLLLSSSSYSHDIDNKDFWKAIKLSITEKSYQEEIEQTEYKDFFLTLYNKRSTDKKSVYELSKEVTYEQKKLLSDMFHNLNFSVDYESDLINTIGYGLPDLEKAILSFENRVLLWDENKIGLNKVAAYSITLPDIFFETAGNKKIIVTLTYNPETRMSRGDSYLGNTIEFYLYHSINPKALLEHYGEYVNPELDLEQHSDIGKYEIDLFPGKQIRKSGCHQKAIISYNNKSRKFLKTPITLILKNNNKWIKDTNKLQDYCVSVVFEHQTESDIGLYQKIKQSLQLRMRS